MIKLSTIVLGACLCVASRSASAYDDQYHRDIDQCGVSDMECFGRAARAYDARLAGEREAAESQREAARQAEVEYQAAVVAFDKQTEPLRQRAAERYLALVRSLYPHLNYIAPLVMKQGDSFELYCAHPLFSNLSFASGPQGPRIAKWVHEHAAELRAARISSVGVTSEAGSHVAYDVPARGSGRKVRSSATRL